MTEALCESCVHRRSPYFGELGVETLRYHLGDLEDMSTIGASPLGSAIMGALVLPRPERCHRLREILPPVKKIKGQIAFAECPEVNLMEYLGDDETFSQADFQP